MKNVFKACLCICMLGIIACSSEDLTTEVVGSYLGTYEEFGDNGSISFDETDMTITKTSDDGVKFNISILGLSISFDGNMVNLNEVDIPTTTIGTATVSGSAKLEGSNIKVQFTDTTGKEVITYTGTKQ